MDNLVFKLKRGLTVIYDGWIEKWTDNVICRGRFWSVTITVDGFQQLSSPSCGMFQDCPITWLETQVQGLLEKYFWNPLPACKRSVMLPTHYSNFSCSASDSERLSLFPNLDYKDLYDTLYEFIPDIKLLTNIGKTFHYTYANFSS